MSGGWIGAVAVAAHGAAAQDLQGQAAQAFYEVAGEVVDVPFGVAEAAELFQVYGLSADTVCLFKKVRRWQGSAGAVLVSPSPHQPWPRQFDEGRTDFPVDPAQGLDVAELTQLLRVHSLELVMEFTNEVRPIPIPVPEAARAMFPLPSPSSSSSDLCTDIRCQDPPPHAAFPQQVLAGAAGTAGWIPGGCRCLPGQGEEMVGMWRGDHGAPQPQCHPPPA